jgi:glutathione S-transferase
LSFEFRSLVSAQPQHSEQLAALWPLCKFPVLKDSDAVLIESSIIIEHLDLHHPSPRLIPADPSAALDVPIGSTRSLRS